jgi:serine/threonine-protein kinase
MAEDASNETKTQIAEPGEGSPLRTDVSTPLVTDVSGSEAPRKGPDPLTTSPDLSTPSTSADAWIGRVLDGRYRLNETIGSGGFGFVFRAKHMILGRDVAVKILQTDAQDALARARFERESSMLAALSHPHIVTVMDYGVSDGTPYLVMELVEGESLRQLMDLGVVSPERAVRIVVQILKALAYAHERGIVHRDLKPLNVLVQSISGEDHVKLLDFGFAKFFGDDGHRPGNSLTQAGTAFGTTGYVAPEQLGSKPVDGRVDLYAAAVIVFESCAGRRPFQSDDDAINELRATLVETAPALSEKAPKLAIAKELDPIVAKGLAKEPDGRFDSALEMAQALESVVPPRASTTPAAAPKRVKRAEPSIAVPVGIAAALMLAVIAAVGWAISASDEPDETVAAAPAEPADGADDESLGGEFLLGPAIGDRPAFSDPWAPPLPEELASIREHLEAGQPLEATERRVLYRRIQNQPWDPRPHLLLAYSERDQRSFTAAIASYERAYRAGPACRADPHMIRDLVVWATHASVATRATDALLTIYGVEALPAIDRALAVSSVHPRTHDRLEALRARIVAGEGAH